MKIISWNTNGLRATAKQGYFNPLFAKFKPDILCLQETKAEPYQLPENVRNVKGYYSYFSHPKTKKGYSGVAIYTREKPIEVFEGMGIKALDGEGRLIGAKFKNFTLINGYYPNGGQGPDRLKYKLEFYEAFSFVRVEFAFVFGCKRAGAERIQLACQARSYDCAIYARQRDRYHRAHGR